MNIETRGVMVLSLALVLMACVYAWVNRHHYHIYGRDNDLAIRENIFTMDRCTLRLGFMDELSIRIVEGDMTTTSADKSVFPDFCKDTPEN
jgi:hypothetical protein